MFAIASLVLGAVVVTVGVGMIFLPAGVIAAGLFLCLAGWDLSQPDEAAGPDQ